ncbi:hypothetical protein B566_EDAN013986 [Ephemera danica]|nr:hypothetical protein B566_EDAN013986 [Ephemera danica]
MSGEKKEFERLPKVVSEKTDRVVLNVLDLVLSDVSYRPEGGDPITPTSVDLSVEQETATLTFDPALTSGKGQLALSFTGELNDKMKGFYRSQYTSPHKFNAGFKERVVLNALDLVLSDVSYRPEGGDPITPTSVDLSVEQETATLTFDPALTSGKGQLALSFTGELNDKMKGFYRSQYTSREGFCAVTLLCPCLARRMFPCWDEPQLKATFDINIRTAAPTVLSNMFERTPIMSTYLVAVVVGEFDYVEDVSGDGVKVRVYTPVGKKEQGKFALHVATKVLPYYKDYFQVAYPLPKIDLIAIADFSAGAMENWGLVTYRETCLLVDPENTSAVRKQWIALVVGHELAHQWFGNLVTMEWWTHLWLNEGYASFVEFLCVAHLFPEYDIWTQFVTDTYIRALELDALNNSHPIEDFRQGMQLYLTRHQFGNAETEDLWAALEESSGKPVKDDFRQGMQLYLTRHQFGNAETEDLWAALEESSGKPVKDVMSSWTKQQGFPVISVSSTQQGDARTLALTQHRFCADGSAQGQFLTRYSPEMLSQLIPAIRDRTLPPLDRLGLLDDLFAMVQAGHSGTAEVLRLMQAFSEGEENFTVWSSVNNCLAKLDSLLAYAGPELDANFRSYARNLMRNIYAKLGWDPLPGEKAKKRFEMHVAGTTLLPADLRSPVYRAVLSQGDKSTFDAMLKEEVRAQDTVFVIVSVAATREGRDLAWTFFQQNWQTFMDRYQGGFLIARLVKLVTENFATEAAAKEIEAFFTSHPTPGTERTIQQSIETIHLNAAWLGRDLDQIRDFLASQ